MLVSLSCFYACLPGLLADKIHLLISLNRLSGLLGLDSLGEDLVASLAKAVGVQSPAVPGSNAEALQVAALSALITTAANPPDNARLGGGWVTVLRTLSALEELQVSFP
jgi:hypothetical protein